MTEGVTRGGRLKSTIPCRHYYATRGGGCDDAACPYSHAMSTKEVEDYYLALAAARGNAKSVSSKGSSKGSGKGPVKGGFNF